MLRFFPTRLPRCITLHPSSTATDDALWAVRNGRSRAGATLARVRVQHLPGGYDRGGNRCRLADLRLHPPAYDQCGQVAPPAGFDEAAGNR
eukprot:246613-Prymnesium_polylepis.1